MNDDRLSRIDTLWSVVQRAHGAEDDSANAAREQLLIRYGGAVRRYLLGALRNEDAADELFQEFAMRLVRGDFDRACPERGRFRQFVKTSIFHLIIDSQRRRRRVLQPLDEFDPAASDEPDPMNESDEEFRASWRTELLARAWAALESDERETGKLYFTVLRFRADHPDLGSPQIAEQLGGQLGRTLTSANVRVLLHRAREVFADRLLEEVAHSLENDQNERIEEELIELNLLEYCRPALERRRGEADQ